MPYKLQYFSKDSNKIYFHYIFLKKGKEKVEGSKNNPVY